MVDARTAAFVGTMNAMPMAYALELKCRGWDVIYHVDVNPLDALSRPEYKFPSISYPYPSWIVERPVRSHLVAALTAGLTLRDVVRTIRLADVVFLSGLFLPLARFRRADQRIVFLSYGSDLDVWCDRDAIPGIGKIFERRLGRWMSRKAAEVSVSRMISGLRSVDSVVTFPKGLSPAADRVLDRELAGTSVGRVPRYDISFADLPANPSYGSGPSGEVLKIICGTRHTFRAHAGIGEIENKATDRIIRGVAAYSRAGRMRVELHLFEKGMDLAEAKMICSEEGISDLVVWHGEMGFQQFLQLHAECHVAFDQVGSHWVGAGMYAMYLGMPLVANDRREVLGSLWQEESPICLARNEGEIVEWLRKLEDPVVRAEIGSQSRRFALQHFDCALTLDDMLAGIDM